MTKMFETKSTTVPCSVTGWMDLFARQVYRDMVLDSWRYCQAHKGFQVHAYTIMSNHLHLIASCKPPFRLEEVMRDWKAFTARQVITYLQDKTKPESRRELLLQLFGHFAAGRKEKQNYQVWQHDNHPIELYSEHVVSQKLDYIHLNAVRAGYVDRPEDWRYSSAPFYGITREGWPKGYEPLLPIVPIWQWFYEEGCGGYT
jgi:putative transposase